MSSSEVLSAVKDYIFKKVSNSLEKKMEEFVKKLIIVNEDNINDNVKKGINELNPQSGDIILTKSKIPIPYDTWTNILKGAPYEDTINYGNMRDKYIDNEDNPVKPPVQLWQGGNKKRDSKKRRKMGKKSTRKQRGGNLDTLANALQTIATVYEDKNKPIDFDVISEPILDFIKKTVEKKRKIITISLNSIADATTPNSFQQILENEIEDKIEEVVIEDLNKNNDAGKNISDNMTKLESFIRAQDLLLLVEGNNRKQINNYYIEKENANANANASENANSNTNASEKSNETRDATPVINNVHPDMNYENAKVFVNSDEKFKTQFKNQVKELFNNHYKAFQTANANANDDIMMKLVHYDFGSSYNMPYNKLATELTQDPSFNAFMNKQCSSANKNNNVENDKKTTLLPNPLTQKKDQIICNGNNLIEKFITYKYETNDTEDKKLRLLERVYNYSVHRQYNYNTNGDLLYALNNDKKFRKNANVVGKRLLTESIKNPRGTYQLYKMASAFDSQVFGKGY